MSNPLRIAISSIGRFHMFDLARQMIRLGQDVRLFTGYPMFKVDRDLQPFANTRSMWVLTEHLRKRIPPVPKTTWWADRSLEDFGRWLARGLRAAEIDVLDALAGTGLEVGRMLHEEGKPWVCNRGSTHILTQKQLLEDEHARWGALRPYFSQEGIERCLAEYAEADAIMVPSEFARRSFIERGIPGERVFKCPYGVDLSLFRPFPPQDHNNRFRVVCVGTCSIRKGIGYLLDAVQPLAKRGTVETWLIGGVAPEARPILEAHAGEFVYQGIQPRAALAAYLSQCDVLVLPSIEEGLALVQAQAMACGLPVIATNNTGAEDLFTDGVEGFILPARDPKAIHEKIQWMLDNPKQLKEMGRAALQRVSHMEGWKAYGDRCLATYRQILAGKGYR